MILKHKLALLVIGLVAVASLASCCPLLIPKEPKREVYGQSGWRLELWVSQNPASVGEPIDIGFSVKNIDDETQIIEIDYGPVMDIKVRQGSVSKPEVWWSDVNEVTPEMRRLELAPGESKTIEMTWVPPGTIGDQNGPDARVAGFLYMLNRRGEQERIPITLEICVEMCDRIGI